MQRLPDSFSMEGFIQEGQLFCIVQVSGDWEQPEIPGMLVGL